MTTSLKLRLTALFATIASVLAACLVATPVAQASASGGCNPPGSTTIAQDTVGRIYTLGAERGSFGGPSYYCAFTEGRGHPLPYVNDPRPDSGSFADVASVLVSGRYLAFFEGGRPNAVDVIDMVAAHETFRYVSGGPPRFPGSGQLVLKPNGSVAWIETAFTGFIEVYRHDSTGTTIVDSGPAIDPHSLAAGGFWLYWTNAGSPRSAAFH